MASVYGFLYVLMSARQNIRDHAAGFVMSMVAVSFTLILFASYLLFVSNLQSMGKRLGEHLQITAYIEMGISAEELSRADALMKGMEEFDSVAYRSPDEALESLKRSLGKSASVLAGISDNPLPASFDVRLKAPYRNLDSIRRLAARLEQLKGVRDVEYGGDWIERFFGFLRIVYWLGASLGILLLAATVIVISSTLSLGFYARKEEIDILRLVGASEAYVRFPFFWEAVLQGTGGAVLAVGLLWILYQAFRMRALESWSALGGWISFHFLSSWGVLGFVLLGAVVGVFSWFISFARFSPKS